VTASVLDSNLLWPVWRKHSDNVHLSQLGPVGPNCDLHLDNISQDYCCLTMSKIKEEEKVAERKRKQQTNEVSLRRMAYVIPW